MAVTGPRPGLTSGASGNGPNASTATTLHKESPSMICQSLFRPSAKARGLVAAALAALVCLVAPATARAQFGLFGSGIVFDPSNFARNVLHYVRRLEQMNLQRQQFQEQLTALRKLQNPHWRDITGTLTQTDALLAQGEALGYSLRAIDAEFRRTFPGAQVFRNYRVDQQTQALRTLATLRGALTAANQAAQAVPASVARLDAIKRQL